jgi:hypothetical protein
MMIRDACPRNTTSTLAGYTKFKRLGVLAVASAMLAVWLSVGSMNFDSSADHVCLVTNTMSFDSVPFWEFQFHLTLIQDIDLEEQVKSSITLPSFLASVALALLSAWTWACKNVVIVSITIVLLVTGERNTRLREEHRVMQNKIALANQEFTRLYLKMKHEKEELLNRIQNGETKAGERYSTLTAKNQRLSDDLVKAQEQSARLAAQNKQLSADLAKLSLSAARHQWLSGDLAKAKKQSTTLTAKNRQLTIDLSKAQRQSAMLTRQVTVYDRKARLEKRYAGLWKAKCGL